MLGACRHEHLLPVLGFAADGERAGGTGEIDFSWLDDDAEILVDGERVGLWDGDFVKSVLPLAVRVLLLVVLLTAVSVDD